MHADVNNLLVVESRIRQRLVSNELKGLSALKIGKIYFADNIESALELLNANTFNMVVCNDVFIPDAGTVNFNLLKKAIMGKVAICLSIDKGGNRAVLALDAGFQGTYIYGESFQNNIENTIRLALEVNHLKHELFEMKHQLEAYSKLTGYTFWRDGVNKQDAQNDYPIGNIHPQDREKIVRSRQSLLSGKENTIRVNQFRYKQNDGNYKLVQERMALFLTGKELEKSIIGVRKLLKKRPRYTLPGVTIKSKYVRNNDKGNGKISAVNSQLISAAILAAQENERQQLGGELHDNINQILAATMLYLNVYGEADIDMLDIIGKCKSNIMMVIDEIRKLSRMLVLPLFAEGGLMNALYNLATDLRHVKDININIKTEEFDESMINKDKMMAVYRIVQEQLNNILKYASAKNIDIILAADKNEVNLTINDDGVGFDTSLARKGIGITNIFRRAEVFNGQVYLESKPGSGCKLAITLRDKLIINESKGFRKNV